MEGVPAGALRIDAAGGAGPWYLYTPLAGRVVSVEAKKFAGLFLDAEGNLNTELVTERRVVKWKLGALHLAEEELAGSRRPGELPSLRISTTYSRLTPRSGTHGARLEGGKMVLCAGACAEFKLSAAPNTTQGPTDVWLNLVCSNAPAPHFCPAVVRFGFFWADVKESRIGATARTSKPVYVSLSPVVPTGGELALGCRHLLSTQPHGPGRAAAAPAREAADAQLLSGAERRKAAAAASSGSLSAQPAHPSL